MPLPLLTCFQHTSNRVLIKCHTAMNSKMFCCSHCSMLFTTTLIQLIKPDSASTTMNFGCLLLIKHVTRVKHIIIFSSLNCRHCPLEPSHPNHLLKFAQDMFLIAIHRMTPRILSVSWHFLGRWS